MMMARWGSIAAIKFSVNLNPHTNFPVHSTTTTTTKQQQQQPSKCEKKNEKKFCNPKDHNPKSSYVMRCKLLSGLFSSSLPLIIHRLSTNERECGKRCFWSKSFAVCCLDDVRWVLFVMERNIYIVLSPPPSLTTTTTAIILCYFSHR